MFKKKKKETHFRPRDTYRLKVRGWKKIFHANGNQKKAGAGILLLLCKREINLSHIETTVISVLCHLQPNAIPS